MQQSFLTGCQPWPPPPLASQRVSVFTSPAHRLWGHLSQVAVHSYWLLDTECHQVDSRGSEDGCGNPTGRDLSVRSISDIGRLLARTGLESGRCPTRSSQPLCEAEAAICFVEFVFEAVFGFQSTEWKAQSSPMCSPTLGWFSLPLPSCRGVVCWCPLGCQG